MTEDLDPKLQEFESKLRRLKPLECESLRPLRLCGKNKNYRRGAKYAKGAAWFCATAIAVLVIVCLIPEPQSVVPKVEQIVVNEPPITPPTIRQQLTQMIDEMYAGVPITDTKPVYPVVEIVVCDASVRQEALPTMYSRVWLTRALDLYEL
jgi:antitoxin (DNA-binding transcriptional repressor) of toxin-antitoxin stability system